LIEVNKEAASASNELKQVKRDLKLKTDLVKQLEILVD
jgi:hypothetical protein